jgi:hypothetical protein
MPVADEPLLVGKVKPTVSKMYENVFTLTDEYCKAVSLQAELYTLINEQHIFNVGGLIMDFLPLDIIGM